MNMETYEYCHLKIYLAIAISEIKINIPAILTFIFLKKIKPVYDLSGLMIS